MIKNYTSKLAYFFYLIFITISFTSNNAFAQRKLGNEWIVKGQDYYKVKITTDGFYRIKSTDFTAAGVNLASYDANKLQVYYRGQEIPVNVSATGTTLNYVEFYGRRNDGGLDSVLYGNPKDQAHHYFSIYSDTAVYFVTWGQKNGLRFKDHPYSPTSYPAITSNIEERAMYYHDAYYDGHPIIPEFGFTGSDYSDGEGWGSNKIQYTGSPVSLTTSIITEDLANSTIKPQVEFVIYGKSDVKNLAPDHHLLVEISPDNKTFRTIYDTTYDGFWTIHRKLNVNASDIGAVTYVKVSSLGASGTTSDVHVISYIKIRYPKKFNYNYEEKYNFFNNNTDSLNYIKYSGSGLSARPSLNLYDLTNGYKTKGYYISGDTAHFVIPNSKKLAEYFLSAGSPVSISGLSKVNFNFYDSKASYNFIIVTHPLMAASVAEYAAYKATQNIDSVNKFKPLTVYTTDLYDQFFYGQHHPAAIQNFMRWLFVNAPIAPKYLLLMGKGIEEDLIRYPSGGINKTYKEVYAMDLVPLTGVPPTDLMLTSGIDNGFIGYDTTLDPRLGIGRVSAQNDNDVRAYLGKLMTTDSLVNPAWRKDMILISGGDNEDQQTRYKTAMLKYADWLSGPQTGAKTTLYSANNAQAVFKDLKDAIQGNLNRGAGMLNYLAHGSANVLGVDIGDFNKLANKGKYPIMYLNGCSVGNPGTVGISLGETYLLAKDKGAIVWLSHGNETLDDVLPSQMDSFYTNTIKKAYGQSIGNVWRQTLVELHKAQIYPNEHRALSFQWIIQGDPSVKMPFVSKPDYSVGTSAISISPANYIASDNKLSLVIPINNYGRVISKPLAVRVKQTLPNGLKITYKDTLIAPVNYSTTLNFSISKGRNNFQGNNKFEVTLDPDTLFNEITRTNNTIKYDHFIAGEGARGLFPTDFNIVATDTPSLVIQSRNIFDQCKAGALFEMDTTVLFNSPIVLRSAKLAGSNVLAWKPKLTVVKNGQLKDTTVYYWRVRLNLPKDSGGDWEVHSFTYIKGSQEGWSQSHFPQYNGMTTNSVDLDSTNRVFNFNHTYQDYLLNCNPWSNSGLGIKNITGGSQFLFGVKGSSTLIMMTLDKITALPVFEDGNVNKDYTTIYGPNPNYPVQYLQFDMRQKGEQIRFASYVNKVSSGNYVFFVTRGVVNGLKSIDTSAQHAFKKLGAKLVFNLKRDSTGYVFAGIKEDVNGKLIVEDTLYDPKPAGDPNYKDIAQITPAIPSVASTSGSITSIKIGPAIKWNKFDQKYAKLEKISSDKWSSDIIGLDHLGNDSLLFTNVVNTADLSKIDAKTYPYLKILTHLEDTAKGTPPQLKIWKVLYDGAPEGTIKIDNKYLFSSNNVAAGDSLYVNVRYENISDQPMDTAIMVTFTISGDQGIEKKDTVYYQSLKPGEYFYINKAISTKNIKDGTHDLSIFVNEGYRQPEITLDNNVLHQIFLVHSDKANPILDVTFDGVHIKNGDYISASPNIKVNALDENAGQLLNDTSLFNITLQIPQDLSAHRLNFKAADMSFKPALVSTDWATINYHPQHLDDGTYIFSAQVKDKSGNISGNMAFDIAFQVLSRTQASYMYVYPNPMSDYARFVFTLTGSRLPSSLVIEIFDITGHKVAEIGKNSLANAHIGENEFIWNGTNSSGARLASGIYTYKISAGDNSQWDQLMINADMNVGKGYGKFIIIH